ncbi:MAG: hypothetical protein WCK63_15870 [Betaproteobacteria bacterium]
MKSKIIGTLSAMLGWPTIYGSASWIGSMWRRVSPFRLRHGRNETFAEAVQRVGATQKSLAANRRNFAFAATIHLLATVVALGFVVSAFLRGESGFALIGFAALNGALAFTFAFRHWQIRQCRLGGVSEFLCLVCRFRSRS